MKTRSICHRWSEQFGERADVPLVGSGGCPFKLLVRLAVPKVTLRLLRMPKSGKVRYKLFRYRSSHLHTLVIALQVEWAKTQARAARFTEEVELVLEELRRG